MAFLVGESGRGGGGGSGNLGLNCDNPVDVNPYEKIHMKCQSLFALIQLA